MIVLSLAGRTPRGDPASTGAGPRTTNGVTGPTAKALLPFEPTRSSGARPTSKRLSHPVWTAPFNPALEHVLAIEMRALAIGRGSGVDDDRLVRFEHAVQIWHRWIEREEIVELECRGLAVDRRRLFAAQRQPTVAAQRTPTGISHGSLWREAVERTAEHDRKNAGVAPFGARELRQIRPGEQGPRGEQQSPG